MYRITRALAIGRFPSPERAEDLRAAGITHILNVSEAPSAVSAAAHGFREVEWVPLEDRAPLHPHTLGQLLDTLHGMVIQPDAQVYVHCIAGQLRSPTLLWLYLIACGIASAEAREWIEDRSPDASPGSTRMIDDSHLRFAEQHGLARFRPHPRAEVLALVALSPLGVEASQSE
jgi:protein-tyrosine phosphatase